MVKWSVKWSRSLRLRLRLHQQTQPLPQAILAWAHPGPRPASSPPLLTHDTQQAR